MTNADQPINPWTPNSPWDHESAHGFRGLTKREYFAAMAMQGILSGADQLTSADREWVSTNAIIFADDILKKLEEQQ